MRIAIATVQVPFVTGGAEIHCDLLKNELIKRGHKVEVVTIPFKWYPTEQLVNSMMICPNRLGKKSTGSSLLNSLLFTANIPIRCYGFFISTDRHMIFGIRLTAIFKINLTER